MKTLFEELQELAIILGVDLSRDENVAQALAEDAADKNGDIL